MTVIVTRTVERTLLASAMAAHPLECCGLLLGEGCKVRTVIPARNVAPRPQTRFEIDPQALIDAHRASRGDGEAVLGYFHSHPGGEARPSATDREQASGDGRIWAIVAGAEIGWWRDEADGFTPLAVDIIDDTGACEA